jgi:hypothetical protein
MYTFLFFFGLFCITRLTPRALYLKSDLKAHSYRKLLLFCYIQIFKKLNYQITQLQIWCYLRIPNFSFVLTPTQRFVYRISNTTVIDQVLLQSKNQ